MRLRAGISVPQRFPAGLYRAAGGINIIDQQYPIRHSHALVRRKGLLNVQRPQPVAKALLRCRIADAQQQVLPGRPDCSASQAAVTAA